MIEIITEKIEEAEMSTSSAVDMNPTGKPKRKKKCETFSVSDDCFHKFRHGKTKFERWSKYLDLTDESQKKIYDWARKHHNGTIIIKNSVTGQVRGIRYNRTGGGQWGKIMRLKEHYKIENLPEGEITKYLIENNLVELNDNIEEEVVGFGNMLAEGEYKLKDQVTADDDEIDAQKGDIVAALEDTPPSDRILGVDIFPVVHQKSNKKIYISLEDIND